MPKQPIKAFADCVNVLREINNIPGTQAYVAGGWVRDKLNGFEPKDIDIFVTGVSTHTEVRNRLMYAPGYFLEAPKYYGNYQECDMREDVRGVLKYKDSELDIIFMSQLDIVHVIDNFDVSVCQVYGELNEDGEIDVYASKQYLDWIERGIIYRYTNVLTTQDHLDRVQHKFNTELTPIELEQGQLEVVKIGTIYD